jgi:hypothetical protein
VDFRDRRGRYCHAPRRGYKDYSGEKFGRLTVERMAGYRVPKNGTPYRIWKCKCTCGGIIFVPSYVLTSGNTRSCGCLKLAIAIALCKKRMTHGATVLVNGKQILTPEYISWMGALARTRCKTNPSYPNYGAQGVRVCAEWLGPTGFATFRKQMGKRLKGTTLGRHLDCGNYERSNCSWQTRKQQQWNRWRKRCRLTKMKTTKSLSHL